MLARFTLENLSTSSFFLASGRLHPDKYRFEVVPGKMHLVQMMIPAEKLPEVSADMLCLVGHPDAPVKMELIPELRDATAAAQGQVADAAAKIQQLLAEITALKGSLGEHQATITELSKPKEETAATAGRITDEQLECLSTYDKLLTLLLPHAGPEEDPVSVLDRLVDAVPSETPKTDTMEDAKKTPAPFIEIERRKTLDKMSTTKLKKASAKIPDIGSVTERADLIEAILIFEAGQIPPNVDPDEDRHTTQP